MNKTKPLQDASNESEADHSDGIKRFHEHRRANWILKAVVSRILISPASIFCRLRVAISALSASCSCVMPRCTRSRRTLAPKTRILTHSFLLRGTTYYIASEPQSVNDTYIVNMITFFLDQSDKCCKKINAECFPAIV
jgi:hypothetical protein